MTEKERLGFDEPRPWLPQGKKNLSRTLVMKIILFLASLFISQITFGKIGCDFYINQELALKEMGRFDKLNTNYNFKKLTNIKSKEYNDGGYDTLIAYPEGSDPFGDGGYIETPLEYQASITPKNLKLAKFSEIRIFVQKVNGKDTVAGYSIIGDITHPLESSRVFLQDTKTCKVRLAHNYYKEASAFTKTGPSRGWVKVNLSICEKMKSKISAINSSTGESQKQIFRSVVPEPAVTEDDSIAIEDAVSLCGYVMPGMNGSTKKNNSKPPRRGIQ